MNSDFSPLKFKIKAEIKELHIYLTVTKYKINFHKNSDPTYIVH